MLSTHDDPAGAALTRDILAPIEGQRDLLESPLEVAFFNAHVGMPLMALHGLVAQHKITPRTSINYRLDFAIPDIKIAFEMDGITYHATREAFEADRRRDLELEMAGWAVHRFDGALIRNDPDNVVRIAAKLADIRRHGTDNQNRYARPPDTDPQANNLTIKLRRPNMLTESQRCLEYCPDRLIHAAAADPFRKGDIEWCQHLEIWYCDDATGYTGELRRLAPDSAAHEAAERALLERAGHQQEEPR